MSRVAVLVLSLLSTLQLARDARAQSPPTPAGAASISGSVLSEGGEPLAGATVAVRPASDTAWTAGAVTDLRGRFVIEGLAQGRYDLRVTRLGYAAHLREGVALTAGERTAELEAIHLAPEALAIEGVEVRGERPSMVMAPDRTIYSTRDMPVASGGTATDVLRSVPELEVDFNGRVSHQGTGVQIHINGRPAPARGEALDQFLQQFPASRIERVEVIANPSARYDAEGSGGIVNLVLKQNVRVGLSGNVALNGGTQGRYGVSGRLAQQQGRLTLFGGGGVRAWGSRFDRYDLRQNLLAQPATSFEQDARSRNRGDFASLDLSAELRLNASTVLWSSASGYLREWEGTGASRNRLLDAERLPTAHYRRESADLSDGASAEVALGLKRTLGAQGHEVSVELRRNAGDSSGRGRYTRVWAPLADDPEHPAPELTTRSQEQENADVSFQADYVRPLGGGGKVEIGYRGLRRDTGEETLQQLFSPVEAAAAGLARSDFGYGEEFHAGYLLLGRNFERLKALVGVRAERAATQLDLPLTGEVFEQRYTSVFPSANLSYDLEKGREARFSYSRRIERPWVGMLNPRTPSADPLNRREGNPHLKPRYVDNYNVDLSWSGQHLTFRFSPWYRWTGNSWESISRVDEEGVSTARVENASAFIEYGTGTTLALRPTGRVSGSTAFYVFRTVKDADNISDHLSYSRIWWSQRNSASVRVTPRLSVQGTFEVYSARFSGQAWMGRRVASNLGLRHQLWKDRATVNLAVFDPFNLHRFNLRTDDPTFVQTSRTHWHSRTVNVSFSYNFGRAPKSERKARAPEMAQPQEPEAMVP